MGEESIKPVVYDARANKAEQLAIELNSPILRAAISVYRYGGFTWEDAMQEAAFAQARVIHALQKQLTEANNIIIKPQIIQNKINNS